MKIIFLLLLSSILVSGCYLRSKKFWAREESKMEQCRSNWAYMDLLEKQEVRVLLFRDRFFFDIIPFPAFVIGVNQAQDTLAFIDKDFAGEIEIGKMVTVSPATWTLVEKTEIKPVFSVYPKSKTNDLHCAVKQVFYGSFKPL
ncbi:MAG: hypothetical protein E6Q37_08930 [Crocinitomicaceae bacterium]|nr:MAG: hypothetical protein E6Q37_08930 [Crocinitomicaceae bacterium]